MILDIDIGRDIINIFQWLYSVGLGLLGQIFTNLGQGLQKTGVERRSQHKNPATGKSPKKYLILWIVGLIMSAGGVIMLFYALSNGHTPTIASLSGFGIAALTVYSQLVLKEKIGLYEILALVFIITGTATVNLAMKEDIPHALPANTLVFWIVIAALTGFSAILFFYAYIKKPVLRGALYGISAGLLGGCEMLAQKSTTIIVNHEFSLIYDEVYFSLFSPVQIPIYVRLPEFWMSWVFMALAFTILQFGYRWGRAVTIVPSYAALYIIVPFIGSSILFSEKLVYFQWIGIVLVIIGVINLSRLEKTHLSAVDHYVSKKRVIIDNDIPEVKNRKLKISR